MVYHLFGCEVFVYVAKYLDVRLKFCYDACYCVGVFEGVFDIYAKEFGVCFVFELGVVYVELEVVGWCCGVEEGVECFGGVGD